MQIIPRPDTVHKHIKIYHEGTGYYNDDMFLAPVGRNSPAVLHQEPITAVTGWPLDYWYPNILYRSRYFLDKDMVVADTTNNPARIEHIDPKLECGLHTHIDGSHISFGNLHFEHIRGSHTYSISLDDIQDIYTDTDEPVIYDTSYRYVDNGRDLTDPTTVGITNHYLVKYVGLDRGFGRMKVGWFYADTAGDWSWSVDGYDVVEVCIDDKVLGSKYSNSDPVGGAGILYDTINLSVGWHHFFAYTSDRSHAGEPSVWFRRPGGTSWQTLAGDASDGIKWARYDLQDGGDIYVSSSAGSITFAYGSSEQKCASLTFDVTKWSPGEISIYKKQVPRFYSYYSNDWRTSTQERHCCAFSHPPVFDGLRAIAKYAPKIERLISIGPIHRNPNWGVFVRRTNSTQWYKWSSGTFTAVSPTSVDDLRLGNSWGELNSLSDTDWDSLPGNSDPVTTVDLMFTGEAPMFMTSHKKLLGLTSEAQFMMLTKHSLIGEVYAEIRDI